MKKIKDINKWARELDVNYGTLSGRLRRGKTMTEAIKKPIGIFKGIK